MTDGIIQQAFKELIQLRKNYNVEFTDRQIRYIQMREIELIEKIKEETDRLYHIGYIEERKLIGDNQE